MTGWLTALVVGLAVVAIYGTMAPGQALIKRLGLRRFQRGAAPQEDRDFLLRVCEGDATEVDAMLEAERSRFPHLEEGDLYRRAIRTYMNSKPPSREETP